MTFPLRFTASRAGPERVDINFGDKILLPAEALELLTAHISPGEPLLLQIKSRGSGMGPTCFSGVLDFSAPRDVAILPGWMFTQLDIKEKMYVYVSVAHLPKATACSLRPEDPAFFALHDHRAVLETALRSYYAALAEGTTISVKHAGKIFRIAVTSLSPEPACCIIDTDVEVEVLPPLDAEGNMKPLPLAASAAMDMSSDVPLEVPIGHEDGLSMIVAADHFSYAQFLPGANTPIALAVAVSEGDVEFYLGDRTVPRPTRELHCFSCTQGENIGGGAIYVPASENGGGLWYVGVRAYNCPRAECKVSVLLHEGPAAAPAGAASSSSSQPSKEPLKEGFTLCGNCNQQVPSAQFVRHSAFCERNNTKCGRCGQMVLRSHLAKHWHCDACEAHDTPFVTSSEEARAKHMELVHTMMLCECGAELEVRPMMVHKRKECTVRDIFCRYCFNAMKAGEPARDHRDRLRGLTQHESECGGRTDACSTCGASVRLKDMEIHMALHRHEAAAVPMAQPSSSAARLSPKMGKSSAVYVAQPVTHDKMEQLRARAWARAGYGGMEDAGELSDEGLRGTARASPQGRHDEEDALLQAALRESMMAAPSPRGASAGAEGHQQHQQPKTPQRVCANVNCSNTIRPGKAATALLCPSCVARVGLAGEPVSAVLLQALVKQYFTQLTKGCGREGCANKRCATCCPPADVTANKVAVEALTLAKEVMGSPAKVYMCVEQACGERRLAANDLTDLGFPLEWCVLALETVGDDKPAAATWLLNNFTPADS